MNPLGWGRSEEALSEAERKPLMTMLRNLLGLKQLECVAPPAAQDVLLPAVRVRIPEKLEKFASTDHLIRLEHAVGRSFCDLAQLRSRQLRAAPDAVAQPLDEAELLCILEWALRERLAIIPFGGGTSVVGGINPEGIDDCNGAVTVDLRRLDRVLEVNTRERVLHAQAGILGPAVETALRPHGLTARHYPQSYHFSTLGGWIAARGAGHYSTLHAKIEDRVQALKVVLPDGRVAETRPLPASSIGPDPNRLWCGSEGALGVITEVRLRVLPTPAQRATRGVRFKTFEAALEAARAIVQAGLYPAQMRVLDPYEHMLSAMLAGRTAGGALMALGFEGAYPELVASAMQAGLALAQQHGGQPEAEAESPAESGVSDWRQAFFRQPYIRDALLDYAVIADTFETAVPWSRLPTFYHQVRQATLDAVLRVCGTGGVNCRSTHAYLDGASLYFSFYGAGRHGSLVAQWREIKAAAAEAVLKHGGTQSHHHAMGRDHKPWAAQELPQPFIAAIRAAKRELDPQGVMNPGLWFES